jgi:hypothetical protein
VFPALAVVVGTPIVVLSGLCLAPGNATEPGLLSELHVRLIHANSLSKALRTVAILLIHVLPSRSKVVHAPVGMLSGRCLVPGNAVSPVLKAILCWLVVCCWLGVTGQRKLAVELILVKIAKRSEDSIELAKADVAPAAVLGFDGVNGFDADIWKPGLEGLANLRYSEIRLLLGKNEGNGGAAMGVKKALQRDCGLANLTLSLDFGGKCVTVFTGEELADGCVKEKESLEQKNA